MNPGTEVFVKKRTKWHHAIVLEVYDKPKAVRIRYTGALGDEWILKPEEVKTKAEKEAEELAERNAQAQ